MGEKKKRREWVSFWMPHGTQPMHNIEEALRRNELPYFGCLETIDGRTVLMHQGGPGRMSMPAKSAVHRYEAYGFYPDDYDAEREAWAKFYQKHPPIVGTLADFERHQVGWLGPSGDLYCCSYQGHEGLARRIIRTLDLPKNEDEEHSLFRSEAYDTLIANGWIYLSSEIIGRREPRRPTKKQLSVLRQLWEKYKMEKGWRRTLSYVLEEG